MVPSLSPVMRAWTSFLVRRIALSDDGNTVDNANLMRDALILANRLDIPILCHCEDTSTVAPEVDVHVHQPGSHHQPRGVHHLVGLRRQAPLQKADPAVLRQNACMANTSPAVDRPEQVKYVLDRAKQANGVGVYPIAAIRPSSARMSWSSTVPVTGWTTRPFLISSFICFLDRAKQANGVGVYPIAALSKGLQGEEPTDAEALKALSARGRTISLL